MSKIIEKIQKLLALAGSANEHEAALAIEKAHDILAAHNLDMATVESYTPEDPEDETRGMMDTATNYSEKYYGWIWNTVAEAHFCTMFSRRPSMRKRLTIYTLVGRRVNAVVATQLASYLSNTVKRLANEAARDAGRTDHAYKNAFIAGCASRLCVRVREMKTHAPTGHHSNALVVLNADEQRKNAAFIDGAGFTLRTPKSKTSRLDREGLADGRAAAERVSLNQQIGSRGDHLKLVK